MGFLKLIKAKKVPDELPDLITDDIEKETIPVKNEQSSQFTDKVNEKETIPVKNEQSSQFTDKVKVNSSAENVALNLIDKSSDISLSTPASRSAETPLDKSYYNQLENNIKEEITGLEDLEKWYQTKFVKKDTVQEMRRFWEEQTNNDLFNTIGRSFKVKVTEKIKRLQTLEKEWQNIYFDLISKEESIREEERELKRLLSDFLEFCRNREKELVDQSAVHPEN